MSKRKDIDIPVVEMKTIGRKTYIVENIFSEEAKQDLTDKLRRMIDAGIKKEPLLLGQAEVTSDKS